MDLKRLIPLFLLLVPLVFGCGSDDLSAADQAKMKAAMDPGKRNFGTMTPDQKAGFEKWKASASGSGAAPSSR